MKNNKQMVSNSADEKITRQDILAVVGVVLLFASCITGVIKLALWLEAINMVSEGLAVVVSIITAFCIFERISRRAKADRNRGRKMNSKAEDDKLTRSDILVVMWVILFIVMTILVVIILAEYLKAIGKLVEGYTLLVSLIGALCAWKSVGERKSKNNNSLEEE